ncbi:hypothetical protein JTB14_020269 [Gonioctena quinquepunctata]|nr:hypothetical protein JTB14_020269 [Gonioctena quinquepunctata]
MAKKAEWKAVCVDDVWGQGYKLVVKNLKKKGLPYNLDAEEKNKIVETLFPQIEDAWNRSPPVQIEANFSDQEIETTLN